MENSPPENEPLVEMVLKIHSRLKSSPMFEAEDIWFLTRLQVHIYELRPGKTTALLEPLWLLEAVNLVSACETSSARNLLDLQTDLTNLLTSKQASMVTRCVEGML